MAHTHIGKAKATPDPVAAPVQPIVDLPTIRVDRRHLREKTAEALDALKRVNTPPRLFVRGNHLVRLHDATRQHGPVIVMLGEHELRGALARAADFESDGHPVSPPIDVVRDVLALGKWSFPRLERVVEAPVLRPNGSILSAVGYDLTSAIFYAPGPHLILPPIPRCPTWAEVIDARLLLRRELLGDFPFVDAASRANALALLLTPILRPMIAGPTPLALIDKPIGGTGASLLAEVVAIIATGREAAMMSQVEDEAEWRKQITATLRDGPMLVVIDDVESAPPPTAWARSNRPWGFRSKSLARALTSTTWKDRILGKSTEIELPQRAVWIATGNNISIGRDFARRSYRIRLDACMEHPEERPASSFRHPLPTWALEQRGRLLVAILTLVRGWTTAGRPEPTIPVPTIGGFTNWAETLGAILAYAGVKGFLQNMEGVHEEIDEETKAWAAFVVAWFRTFGSREVTVSQIEKKIQREGSALRMALPPDLARDLGPGFTQRLGCLLRRHVDQIVLDKFSLKRAGLDRHEKTVRWQVVER